MKLLLKEFFKLAEDSAEKARLLDTFHACNKIKQAIIKKLFKAGIDYTVEEAYIDLNCENVNDWYDTYSPIYNPVVCFNGVFLECFSTGEFTIKIETTYRKKVYKSLVSFDIPVLDYNKLLHDIEFLNIILKDIDAFKAAALKAHKNYESYKKLRDSTEELLDTLKGGDR